MLAIAATLADLGTFVVMLALRGPGAEANPVVRAAIAAGLLVAILGAKLAVVLAIIAWHAAVGRLDRPVWITGLVIGGVGTVSNLLAMGA
jgi:hypothetical protein